MADHDDRRSRAPEITARLAEAIAGRSAADVVELAVRHDVAISRVNDAEEARTDPQIAARDIFPDSLRWRPLGPVAPAVRLDVSSPAV